MSNGRAVDVVDPLVRLDDAAESETMHTENSSEGDRESDDTPLSPVPTDKRIYPVGGLDVTNEEGAHAAARSRRVGFRGDDDLDSEYAVPSQPSLSKLSAEAVLRPRSYFRKYTTITPRSAAAEEDRKKHGAVHVATRANYTLVRKSGCSRIKYTAVVLNLVLWIPVWLKLIGIERRDPLPRFGSVYNQSVSMSLEVSALEGGACSMCDERSRDDDDKLEGATSAEQIDDEMYGGVTYPVTAYLENFYGKAEVGTPSYVLLFGSNDFEHWELFNSPGVFTGLEQGDQEVQVCSGTPIGWGDDDDDESVKATTFTDSYLQTDYLKEEDDRSNGYQSEVGSEEWESEWVTKAPAFFPRTEKAKSSTCCLGNPGYVYLVACATPFGDLDVELNSEVAPPPFDDRCVAVAGRCGSACGVEAHTPEEETCLPDGSIPLNKLLHVEVLSGYESYKVRYHKRWIEREIHSTIANIYHKFFIIFVMVTALSTWISFLPGNGLSRSAPKPGINEIEEYVAAGDRDAKPVVLCVFSISAMEPRMMVLRNMIGKLLSLVNQRKFTLQSSASRMRTSVTPQAKSMPTLFQEDDGQASLNLTKRRDAFLERADGIDDDRSELIDIFQDEGHRVGAYALWDAFVDVVDDCDLRFVEALAKAMTEMPSDRDYLTTKSHDDGSLLDQALRASARRHDVDEDALDKLELAFACFNLLSHLGHHAFWRPSSASHDVLGFRDIAGDAEAVAVLKAWATNHKKAVAKGRRESDPFDSDIVPASPNAIPPNVWSSWWSLYRELGSIQWAKRFDCIRFRLARLNYYSEEACVPATDRVSFRDLMLCYSARANPEDLRAKLEPTRQVKGIRPGVFVRLKECDDSTASLFASNMVKKLSRPEARRCHARVVAIVHDGYRTYVKLHECTPDLLDAIPVAWLAARGNLVDNEGDTSPSGFGRDGDGLEDDHEAGILSIFLGDTGGPGTRPDDPDYAGEEAIVPIELVQPLRECRGKSGGMNHAMELLDTYLRHHSSTFTLMRQRHGGKEVPQKFGARGEVDAHLLFSIFDARHMGQKGFWDAVLPYFYRYKHANNPWSRELAIDRSIAFVQLPQTFTTLSLDTDIFDMRNEYAFRIANTVRNGVGAITSCGTNAVWNYDLRYQENPLEHRFNEDTMIEDTASSHDVIMAGRKGVYHFERLVLGARKGTTDYLAAVFRWSRGAVQLFWMTFWYPRYNFVWPWASLLAHVVPIVGCIVYLQTQNIDECHMTPLARRAGLLPCGSGPVLGIIADPIFILYAVTLVTIAVASYTWANIGAHLVMFENVTYFFSAVSAFFWLALPCFMCIARNGLPPILDTQLVTIGGIWIQVHYALIIQQIRRWSPLENGKPPSNQSLRRSQEKFFITAPLHVLAMMFGMRDGVGIIFFGKDASRWASFDNITALAAVKVWAVAMICGLISSITVGIFNVIYVDETEAAKATRFIGIFMCSIILFLIESPVRALFFFHSVVKKKEKPSRVDRVTAAIFGSKQVITPDHCYFLMWVVLLVFSLRSVELGESSSVINFRNRCEVHPNADGCKDNTGYTKYFIRHTEQFQE